MGLSCWQGQILTPQERAEHPGLLELPIEAERVSWENPHQKIRYFAVDDGRLAPLLRWHSEQIGANISDWLVDFRGVDRCLNIPLTVGEATIGAIVVYLDGDRAFTTYQIELAQALAHQATLAIQLTKLAEEAKQAAIFEERNRMARDLHDCLAHSLTGIAMQLNAATEFLATQPQQTQACITRAQNLAKQGLAEARHSVWLLYDERIAAGDLSSALMRLVEQIAFTATVPISLDIAGVPHCLNAYKTMNLLRIAQESIVNALRHARPQTVRLQLTYSDRQLQLQINDDGCGFDPERSKGKGFGLRGMSARAKAIGASLQINSQSDLGTQTVVTLESY